MLPDYISKAVPNSQANRAPWYANTAPSYAGVFLWFAFYISIAKGTIPHGGLALCMAAIVVAGLLSYALYYYAPAMLGMKTGFPLYVVGSSTFGTAGGYVMPGLLMGLLQIGWFAVGHFFATRFIMNVGRSQGRAGQVAVHRNRNYLGLRDGVHRGDGYSICCQTLALSDHHSDRHDPA